MRPQLAITSFVAAVRAAGMCTASGLNTGMNERRRRLFEVLRDLSMEHS